MAGRCCLRIDANRRLRHAIEIRHESFRDPAFVKLLRRQRIGLVSRGGEVADARKIVPGLAPPPRKSRDVYCYFDNDAKVHAPFDARKLMELVTSPGR